MNIDATVASPDRDESHVIVTTQFAPKINYALEHNSVPVLRELCIENASEGPITDLTLEIRSEPAVIVPKRWLIDRVGPGERFYVDDLDVRLDAGLLWNLSEAITASLHITATSGDSELAYEQRSLEVLARNEWGGATGMPEMIAAFVSPNDPAVEKILKSAAGILRENGLSPALDGYQSGSPQRVAEIVGAIWSAVGALSLNYSEPPASFERDGQKVRTPSHAIASGLGTCLDLTLLFAACLEQAGINPIIVFQVGHAFVGCWLHNEQFADVVIDDPAALRNRIRLGDVLFFETTLVTRLPTPAFTVAVDGAVRTLSEDNDTRFAFAVDVRRARMQRIRPVPSEKPAEHNGWSGAGEVSSGSTRQSVIEIPELPQGVLGSDPDAFTETPASRFDRWQRKLLDLSLRNRLLNFRQGKSAVVLHCPDPGKLEDMLAEGTRLKILPLPQSLGESGVRSSELHRQRHYSDLKDEYAREGLDRREVFADMPPKELELSLVELYRRARTGLQEGGANVLYLAMGFLVWRKGEEKDERAYRAPLVLVPVSLERKNARSPMYLVRHDDESRVNPTLLQMLEQDFAIRVPELQKPLEDESGVDLKGIWNVMRRAIKDIKGWEVTEEVALSTFSFAKYLMWKDLVDRTDQLKLNPVVRHLLETPRAPYISKGAIPEPWALDKEFSPDQTFTLLPADSSQLAAIMAMASGKDLVIEGPPGTGKSQTIANMIAHCLGEGRTVLFVSEKSAALDVVYRRLRDVGLGDFCLELHSNKARKADVLEQLRRAWESQGNMSREEWVREATRLGRLRDSLNRFVEELHKVYPNGLTPFLAMGHAVRGKDVPRIRLSWPSPDIHDRDSLDELRELVGRIQVIGRELGDVSSHPLRTVERVEWSPKWQTDLVDRAGEALEELPAVSQAAEAFLDACSLPRPRLSKERLDALIDVADVLTRAYGKSYGFCLDPDAPIIIDALSNALSIINERRTEVEFLSCEYNHEVLASLNVDDLLATWQRSSSMRWPSNTLARRKVEKALKQAVSGKSVPDIPSDLPRLKRIRECEMRLAERESLLRRAGSIWMGVETDVDSLRQACEDASRLRSALLRLYPSSSDLSQAQQRVRSLLMDAHESLAPEGEIGREARNLVTVYRRFAGSLASACELAGSSPDKVCSSDQPDWLSAVQSALSDWRKREGQLRNWTHWRRLKKEAIEKGLKPLVDAIESGSFDTEDCPRVFDVNYCRWWASEVVDRSEVLKTFIAAEHEHRIDEFRRLDDRFTQITRDYIRAKLCTGIPPRDDASRGSEWGVLSRELEKKKRHKPIRQLISEMPTALTRLTPCLLMSPLSIAQYLPPGQQLFDVVIFDEASQIPVWDAIGAIARGRQTIVVGDPKQLPPTNFFERADGDDGFAEDVEEDLESILDECLAANLPKHPLSWHYRSRHESLIAFSNHRYYGNRLITFPSPETEDRAVSFRFVPDGVYESGGARVNKPEARALVEEIVSRLKDPVTREKRLTFGVVTFNAEQQKLIEDLLDDERRKDPSIEPWFSEESLEPLMVKNLENVQGDERDVVYFSITYGPDLTGRISMNFGPLNRDGGERRLNVAITRARTELRIFSSLRSENIDLNRTGKLGVRDLKRFLEYAEHGIRAFATSHTAPRSDSDSPFEDAVAAALRERGWDIHPQVGVSKYRVDLGVVDPDAPGRYLAGVECDGATYHRSATARDRDKLREAVLRNLGWKIVRVWSTDWWSDPVGALERLDQQLRKILEESRAERKTIAEQEQESNSLSTPRSAMSPSVLGVDSHDSGISEGRESVPRHKSELSSESAHAGTRSGKPAVVPYRESEFTGLTIDPNRFYDDDYTPILRELVATVIKLEGPIRDELLVRRIARVHGFQRAGSRIRERVIALAKRYWIRSEEPVGVFFWPSEQVRTEWSLFRRAEGEEVRTVDDIPLEELRVLAQIVTRDGFSGEDALREMASYCGISRLGGNVRARFEQALSQVRM